MKKKTPKSNRQKLVAEGSIFSDSSVACAFLAAKEKTLARALEPIGAPHIRKRPGGFAALFRIIVEQQVSVPSAQAIMKRCDAVLKPASPDKVIALGADGLKSLGLSGQKARYVLCLADDIKSGALDLGKIKKMNDDEALLALQTVKGIGPWTAAIYLLFCEGRVDIWPRNDVALRAAYNAAKPRKPDIDQQGLDDRAARWAPYRGVAAHILWTYYAHIRGRTPI